MTIRTVTRLTLKAACSAGLALAAPVMTGPASAQQEVEDTPDYYGHAGTGIVIPRYVGEFERTRVTEFDEKASDVAFSFQSTNPDHPGAFTLYIYPATVPCAEEFSGVLDAIEGGNEQAEEVIWRRGQSRPGFDGTEQYFARFNLPPNSSGFEHPELSSDAWLACPAGGEWLVKLRATYLAPDLDVIDPLEDELIGGIDWRRLFD